MPNINSNHKRIEYIPVATKTTVYYEPKTQQEMDDMIKVMKVGDMLLSPINNLWYTMGLMVKSDPTTMMLFPNIILGEDLQPLTRWGLQRRAYLKEHKRFFANQLGIIGLHKHCLEVQEQAENRKRSMMEAIRKDPKNKVTERDKAQDPMAWVGRMNNFQHSVHEVIYADLIYA